MKHVEHRGRRVDGSSRSAVWVDEWQAYVLGLQIGDSCLVSLIRACECRPSRGMVRPKVALADCFMRQTCET